MGMRLCCFQLDKGFNEHVQGIFRLCYVTEIKEISVSLSILKFHATVVSTKGLWVECMFPCSAILAFDSLKPWYNLCLS